MSRVFLCDFDNTMVEGNVTDPILDRWGPTGWRMEMKRYQDGIESAESVNRRLFAEVDAELYEIGRYAAEKTRVRPGVLEVVNWCAENGVEFVVNSAGLDAYISPILAKHGLDGLRVHAGTATRIPRGLRVTYPGPDGVPLPADAKAARVEYEKSLARYVYYAGDGVSDRPAAAQADHVFARDKLLTFAREQRLPHTPFTDFHDVLRTLQAAVPVEA